MATLSDDEFFAAAPASDDGNFAGDDSWGRTVLQFPLGVVRGLSKMLQSGSPAKSDVPPMSGRMFGIGADISMEAAAKKFPRLAKALEDVPTEQEYEKQRLGMLEGLGVEGDMSPRNAWERVASGAGEGVPWGAMMGPTGFAGNMATSIAGGAGGALAEEFTEDAGNKPWANLFGSLVGSFGMAGALSVMRHLQNVFSPKSFRRLPGEFDLPATAGMIEDPSGYANPRATAAMQRGVEENLEKGEGLSGAQRVMERAREAREAEILAHRNRLANTTAPRTSPEEAGEVISQGLKSKAEEFRSEGDRLYKLAGSKGAWAMTDEFNNPRRAIERTLKDEALLLDSTNHPEAMRAMRLVDKWIQPDAGDDIKYLSINKLEKLRQGFNQLKPKYDSADARAVKLIKDGYDNWFKEMVDDAMFHGDKTVVDDLKNARSAWGRYRTLTDVDNKRDYTRWISNIVNKDYTGKEVADWLTNTASVGMSGKASRAARFLRRTFGENSEEWKVLRQALLFKALGFADEAESPGKAVSQLKIAKNIDALAAGKGSPLGRVVFKEDELNTLRNFAAALRKVNPTSINPSGTSFNTVRVLMAGALGLSAGAGAGASWYTGNPWWLAVTAAPFVRDAKKIRDALKATTNIRRAPPAVARTAAGMGPALVDEEVE